MPARPKLKDVVAALRRLYGEPKPFFSSDPWELVLHENAAYLVDDATRGEVFRSLKSRVGLSPESILGAPYERLVEAIRQGGMRPPERANKLLEAAEIAREVGLPELRRLAKQGGPAARRILKRFPGIGDPGADKLLLAAGGADISIAPLSVTPTVCSNWADSERSRVTAVQPSDSTFTCGRPILIIGSTVKNMPGLSTMPSPARPKWTMLGSSWNRRPRPWPQKSRTTLMCWAST